MFFKISSSFYKNEIFLFSWLFIKNYFLLIFSRIAQFRRERRKEERVRRRKNKKLSNSITELKMDINIYIDFGFSYAMNDKEIKKLVRQMGRVWGLQKRLISN